MYIALRFYPLVTLRIRIFRETDDSVSPPNTRGDYNRMLCHVRAVAAHTPNNPLRLSCCAVVEERIHRNEGLRHTLLECIGYYWWAVNARTRMQVVAALGEGKSQLWFTILI